MDNRQILELIKANNLLDFIEVYRRVKGRKVPLSLASLAHRSGLRSRSTLHDLLSGRRSPSRSLLLKLSRGMGLDSPLSRLLLLLSQRDYPHSRFIDHDPDRIDLEIFRCKIFIQDMLNILAIKPDQESSVLNIPFYGQIFASLNNENGVDIAHIQRLTSIPTEILSQSLFAMCKAGIIINDDGIPTLYRPAANFFDFGKVSQNNMAFRRKMEMSLLRQLSLVRNIQTLPEGSLLTEAVFSVSKDELVNLKNELRKTIKDFMINREAREGDCVVNLFCSLFEEGEFHRE